MTTPPAPPFLDWPRIPYIGVGCIVERDGKILLVREHRGRWSTPGGHLDFGESPAACAAREALEEAGVVVSNVRFVAVTNDVMEDIDKHYVTIWMRGDAICADLKINDTEEIAHVGWFESDHVPRPLHVFFENLICGRSMPALPAELPDVLRRLGTLVHAATLEPTRTEDKGSRT
jgi:8-oxo-dGTP diphosphatase